MIVAGRAEASSVASGIAGFRRLGSAGWLSWHLQDKWCGVSSWGTWCHWCVDGSGPTELQMARWLEHRMIPRAWRLADLRGVLHPSDTPRVQLQRLEHHAVANFGVLKIRYRC
eukprot:scaffold78950_cov63-Phaeocystis_antarctica.AAC.4